MFRNKENGYTAFNKLNIIISVVVFALGYLGGAGVFNSISEYGFVQGIAEAFGSGYYKNTGICLIVAIVGLVILLIRNMKMGSFVKSILFTVISVIVSGIIALILFILYIIIGILGGKGSDFMNKYTNNTYTDEEHKYAKANGYYDAESANNMGFDTSDAKRPGFDYTQKKY